MKYYKLCKGGFKLKIYIIEKSNNLELYNYLTKKYSITNNFYLADVLIVNKVSNIKFALDIVDISLMRGKEIICIKNSFSKEAYTSNYLIKNGAMYI